MYGIYVDSDRGVTLMETHWDKGDAYSRKEELEMEYPCYFFYVKLLRD